MSRALRITLLSLALLLVVLIAVPLVWPVPQLRDTVEPATLAFPDSRFIEVDGLDLHYREAGSELAPVTIILLHGFGASTFSWRDQMPLLADRARVVAFDRPAFGLTERPLPGDWRGESPYSLESNANQVIGLMDALDIEKAVLVGHSAGGALAVEVAAAHPDRVEGLVLEAPAVLEARPVPSIASALLRTPQARRIGPLLARRIAGSSSDDFVRGAYHESEMATPGVLAGYRLPLRAKDWDRGLWELVAAPRTRSTADVLGDVTAPLLVVAGENDTYVPAESSREVFDAIAEAQRSNPSIAESESVEPLLVMMPETGHIPHEERPDAFANEVYRFLDTLPGACDT